MQSNFHITTLDACPYCGTRGEAEGPNCVSSLRTPATALAFARLCQHVHGCAFNPKNMPWLREREKEKAGER